MKNKRKRKWLLRGSLILVGLWAGSHLLYQAFKPPTPANPLRIAHRGVPSLAPENTLESYEKAHLLNMDLWETDVRQSKDGVLVLMHDASVARTTSGQGVVEEMTAAQLAALGVPTFDQFLELAGRHEANILPEVKGQSEGIEQAMLRSIEAAGMLEKTRVQSFSTKSLEELQQLKLCRTYYPWILWVGKNPQGVTVVAPMAEALLVNPWMVRQAHGLGLEVWPWFAGLESSFTVSWVLSLGVDGLMVDDPRHWPR